MHVGIDATATASERIVGISRFVMNLVEELHAGQTSDHYSLCFRPGALRHRQLMRKPEDQRFDIQIVSRLWGRRAFRRLDLYHGTDQRPAPLNDVPFLSTLHDVYYLSHQQAGSSRTRHRWQERYRKASRNATLVMTLSEYSKSEILKHLPLEKGDVRVVPLAADSRYRPQSIIAADRARQHFKLTRPYIFFGGGFGERKNLTNALRAFALALPKLSTETILAVGGPGGPSESIQQLIYDLDIDQRVTFLGFIPENLQPGLIAGSLFYFYPSLLEGFGIPVLEAMGVGTPVLTSSTTSLPELCDDAALLADPREPTELANRLVELEGSLTLRQELKTRGLDRCRQFTWKSTAEKVHDLYREVAARGCR